MWPKEIKDWTDLITKIILILAAAIAIPKFFYDRNETLARERAQRSLNFVEKFSLSDIRQARKHVSLSWEQFAYALPVLREQGLTPELHKSIIVKSLQANTQLVNEIEEIISLFEEIDFCIEASLCDRRIADMYFCPYSKSFFRLYRPWLEHKRGDLLMESYGRGLERLSNDFISCRSTDKDDG
jgi:hypothetical protein